MSCPHKVLLFGKHGQYCEACGALVEVGSEQPRHSPDYYAALADGRVLGWRDLGDMPPSDAPYYAAGQLAGDVWCVVRVAKGGAWPTWATNWHHDSLGLPLAPAAA